MPLILFFFLIDLFNQWYYCKLIDYLNEKISPSPFNINFIQSHIFKKPSLTFCYVMFKKLLFNPYVFNILSLTVKIVNYVCKITIIFLMTSTKLC